MVDARRIRELYDRGGSFLNVRRATATSVGGRFHWLHTISWERETGLEPATFCLEGSGAYALWQDPRFS